MTDIVLGLVSTYGVLIIGLSTFLSCLALPIPASIMMLAGGAFIASGDLSAVPVVVAAFGGAVAGDQTGFRIGRLGGHRIDPWLSASPRRARIVARARKLVTRWGISGVFLSRWLLSPLGPWVNVVAGASRMPGRTFSTAAAAGEAVWVGLYVGLGYLFASNLEALSSVLGNTIAAVTAAAAAIGLGAIYVAVRRSRAA